MPRSRALEEKKQVSFRLDADLWDRAEAVAFDELSRIDASQDPRDINMSHWVRDVIREFVRHAEDAEGREALAEKLRAARRQVLMDEIEALTQQG